MAAMPVGARAVEELLARYPRAPFKREFSDLLRREAARKPRCQAAFLMQQGLGQRIADAPFPE